MVKKLVRTCRSVLKHDAPLIKRLYRVNIPAFPFKIQLLVGVEIKLEKLISKR